MKNGLFQKTENDLKHRVAESLWAIGWHGRDKLSAEQMAHRSQSLRTLSSNHHKELHGGHNHIFLGVALNTLWFVKYFYFLLLLTSLSKSKGN